MKGIRVTERTYTQEGKINPKVRKPELSFLYPTCHLALFYISTKYHQILRRVFVLQSGPKIKFKQEGEVRKLELPFLYPKRRSSYSTFLQNTIKYSKGYSSYRADTKSISNNKPKGDNSKSKKARVVILVRDTSSHPVLHFYHVSLKYYKGY